MATPSPTVVDLVSFASFGYIDDAAVDIFVYIAATTLLLSVAASLYAAIVTAPGASEAAQKRASQRASKRASASAASAAKAAEKARLLEAAPGHVRGAVAVGSKAAQEAAQEAKPKKALTIVHASTAAAASGAAAAAASSGNPSPSSFAFADPLLLLFLLQGISLTGRLSGLPRSYGEDVAGAFAWATLDVRPPAWGRGLASLKWIDALAQPEDDDANDGDGGEDGESDAVAALRAQVFYLALALAVSLGVHGLGRLGLWGAGYAAPVFLQRGHVELTALLSVSVAMVAGSVPVLLGAGDTPLAWRLVAGGECGAVLAVLGLLMQRTLRFQAYWVPAANLRRLRVLEDLFPVEKGDGAAEGLALEDVAAAAPELGVTRARSQIIFYELDTRTRGRVDRSAFLAAVGAEEARGVAFAEANYLEAAWALFCTSSRRAGSWAPTNEKLMEKALSGGGGSFAASLCGFVLPARSSGQVQAAAERTAARRRSEFEARVGLEAARAAGIHIAERGVGGFWGRYVTPFCPHHRHYYALQTWRLGLEAVLLQLLGAAPAWQAGCCLAVELSACLQVCLRGPCVLLSQTRHEVAGSLGRVAVYGLATAAHAAKAWGWSALDEQHACGWMALVHLLVLLHSTATYLAPLARPTYLFLFVSHGPPALAAALAMAAALAALAARGCLALRRFLRWAGDGLHAYVPGAKLAFDKCAAPLSAAASRACAACWRAVPPADAVRAWCVRSCCGVCIKVCTVVGAVAVCPFLACFMCACALFEQRNRAARRKRELQEAEAEAAEAEKLRRAAALAAFAASEEAAARRAAEEAAVRAKVAAKAQAKRDAYEAAEQRRFLAREEERRAKFQDGINAENEAKRKQQEESDDAARRQKLETEIRRAEKEFRAIAADAFAQEEAKRFAALEEARARKAAEAALEAEYKESVRKVKEAEAAAARAKGDAAAKRAVAEEAAKARMKAAIKARREEYEAAEQRRFLAREEERRAKFQDGINAEKEAKRKQKEESDDAARKADFEAEVRRAEDEFNALAAAAKATEERRRAAALEEVRARKAAEAALEAEYKESVRKVKEAESAAAAAAAKEVAAADSAKGAALEAPDVTRVGGKDKAFADRARAALAAEVAAAEARAAQANARLMLVRRSADKALKEETVVRSESAHLAAQGAEAEMVDLEAGRPKRASQRSSQPHGPMLVPCEGPPSHARRARAVTEVIGGVILFEPGARALGRAGSWMGGKLDRWGERRRARRAAREAERANDEAAALAAAKAKWSNRRASFMAGRAVDGLPAHVAAAWSAEERADAAETGSAGAEAEAAFKGSKVKGRAQTARNSKAKGEGKSVGKGEGKSSRKPAKGKDTKIARGKSPIHASVSSNGSSSQLSGLTGLSGVPSPRAGHRLGTSLDDTTGTGGDGGTAKPKAPRKAQSADSVL